MAATAKSLGGSIKVNSFVRFEKGEGIEKKVDDFAAEVAAAAGLNLLIPKNRAVNISQRGFLYNENTRLSRGFRYTKKGGSFDPPSVCQKLPKAGNKPRRVSPPQRRNKIKIAISGDMRIGNRTLHPKRFDSFSKKTENLLGCNPLCQKSNAFLTVSGRVF